MTGFRLRPYGTHKWPSCECCNHTRDHAFRKLNRHRARAAGKREIEEQADDFSAEGELAQSELDVIDREVRAFWNEFVGA